MIAIVTYLLVCGALIAAAAHLAAQAMQFRGAPTRGIWAGALLALFLAAAWSPFRGGPAPALVTLAPTVTSAPDAVQPPSDASWSASLAFVREVISHAPGALAQALRPRLAVGVERAFAAAWLATTACLTLLAAAAYVRFHRTASRLPRAVLFGRAVRVSGDMGPAAIGVAAPVIVVPKWLLDASDEEQRITVAHEAEHIAARDPALLLAGCAAVVLLPWHPAAWWLLARLRLAVEMDCDARVLARGVGRAAYGEALVDIASRQARIPAGIAAFADHTTHLERRLIAMTPLPVAYRRTRVIAFTAAAALVAAAACDTRLPSSAEIDRMDVAAVESNPLGLGLRALGVDSITRYYVDGKEVTAAAARAISGSEISSVEIAIGTHPGAGSSLRITTRGVAIVEMNTPRGSRLRPTYPPIRDVASQVIAQGPMTMPSDSAFTGLVFVDGVRATAGDLSRLDPARIESVEVLKGADAAGEFREPEAARGVIRVVTKKAR